MDNQKNRRTVSIAMATYNGETFLNEQLTSFLNQSIYPDELIVCDDRSTDNTLSILREFSTTSPFKVEIYENETNLGYGRNFSKALSICNGDIVFLSDQDDIWHDNKLETMLSLIEEHNNYQLFMHDAKLVTGDLRPLPDTKIERTKRLYGNLNNFVQGSCSAIRRDLIKILLPIPTSVIAHDNWIAKIAQLLDARIVTEEQLMEYRIHGENTSPFHINNPNGSTTIKWLLEKLSRRKAASELLGNELTQVREIRKRVNDIDRRDPIFRNKKKREFLTFTDAIVISLENRTKIRISPIATRLVLAISMLRRKEYHTYHNGMYSFYRDLLLF